MSREKKIYKYHELPRWDKREVKIQNIFLADNGRKRITLNANNNIYCVNVPKRDEWKDIKIGDEVTISVKHTDEKRALLILHKEEGVPFKLKKGDYKFIESHSQEITEAKHYPFSGQEMKLKGWTRGLAYLTLKEDENVWIIIKKTQKHFWLGAKINDTMELRRYVGEVGGVSLHNKYGGNAGFEFNDQTKQKENKEKEKRQKQLDWEAYIQTKEYKDKMSKALDDFYKK